MDIDCQSMTMESYRADEKLQTATVSADLRLMVLRGSKIKERNEHLKMTMIKDAGCKTQAVCGASVLTCKGCGASLSLMEGKTCIYCGRNLDLKQFDWVIADYKIILLEGLFCKFQFVSPRRTNNPQRIIISQSAGRLSFSSSSQASYRSLPSSVKKAHSLHR